MRTIGGAYDFQEVRQLMKVATFNVNGVKSRLSHDSLEWLEETKPVVACLQETRPVARRSRSTLLKALNTKSSAWTAATPRPGHPIPEDSSLQVARLNLGIVAKEATPDLFWSLNARQIRGTQSTRVGVAGNQTRCRFAGDFNDLSRLASLMPMGSFSRGASTASTQQPRNVVLRLTT